MPSREEFEDLARRASSGRPVPSLGSTSPGRGVVFGGVGLVVLGLALFIGAIGVISGFARTGPNEAAVVYNGGPLDKKTQRQTIEPASGLTWTGWLSQDPRFYPTSGSPRRYILTSDPSRGERAGVDVVRVPTSDGVDVGLEAKISFTTTFTGAENDAALREFDARFGNRTYPVPGSAGQRLHPWEGDEGFAAFLDTEFRPVLDNALRESIGESRCEELVSSCALISGGRQRVAVAGPGAATGEGNSANLLRVQTAIAEALATDLNQNLGGEYLDNVQVVVSGVRLPESVQTAVNDAQAGFAEVNKTRADLEKARIRKQVNDTLGASYKNCPACAQQDALKAIPKNVNAISLGGGGSIALGGR